MNPRIKTLLSIVFVLIILAGMGYILFKKNVGTVNIPASVDTATKEDAATAKEVSYLKVPQGFKINLYAKGVSGARVIEMDPKGRILVSETSEGKIVALLDTNKDGVSGEQKVLLSGLNKPHGMAFKCVTGDNCSLYVAERNELVRFSYDADALLLGQKEKLLDISSSITDRHFTRSLLFLRAPNDDTLLISVGSSCNVCNEKDTDHAAVLSYNIKTGKKEVYAKGLRNATFMTLNPADGEVFATEMGRDNLGDNLPPDEINIIEKDKNYGWPFCYGKQVFDENFAESSRFGAPTSVCDKTVPSFVDLQAHSAPLGLAFIPEGGWPKAYWYNLLVAYHGSWNRSTPTGYKIVRIKMNAKGEYLGTEDFITGFLTADGKKLGRPVDIKVFSGGVAYISDDSSGNIYRLSANQ